MSYEKYLIKAQAQSPWSGGGSASSGSAGGVPSRFNLKTVAMLAGLALALYYLFKK